MADIKICMAKAHIYLNKYHMAGNINVHGINFNLTLWWFMPTVKLISVNINFPDTISH